VALAATHRAAATLRIVRIAAADHPALTTRFGVDAVPTVVAAVGGGDGGVTVRATVAGADVPALVAAVAALVSYVTSPEAVGVTLPAAAAAAAAAPAAAAATPDFAALVRRAPVVLFMKGTPEAPRCGFSRQAVALLRDAGVTFDTFDILGDPAVRAGLKTFSDWPTYPQLYAGGEFVGGLDVAKELAEAGELVGELKGLVAAGGAAAAAGADAAAPPAANGSTPNGAVAANGAAPPAAAEVAAAAAAPATPTSAPDAGAQDADALRARLTALVRRSPVMLFMKGTPEAPRCGFSRQAVALLRGEAIPFDTFDILGDAAVRAGLKTFSDWPTYPQLYVAAEFIGGLDVLKETAEAAGKGGLAAELGV